jgi:16S rRNA (uracil1498-N3)-methyltransferase
MDTINEMWRFPRFFVKDMSLSDEDLHHARKVLRIKQGDKVVLCENGTDHLCSYKGGNMFNVLQSAPNQAEPDVSLRLFQCLPKSDKMDYIVQKAVELGVREIVPVISGRCVSKPDAKSATSKVVRWNRIALEAAKQCGRGIVPKVSGVVKFREAVCVNPEDLSIIFYECGGESLNKLISKGLTGGINLFVGSEGGFEASEIELAQSRGIAPATLGKRILRVDTASVAALSVLLNLTENL